MTDELLLIIFKQILTYIELGTVQSEGITFDEYHATIKVGNFAARISLDKDNVVELIKDLGKSSVKHKEVVPKRSKAKSFVVPKRNHYNTHTMAIELGSLENVVNKVAVLASQIEDFEGKIKEAYMNELGYMNEVLEDAKRIDYEVETNVALMKAKTYYSDLFRVYVDRRIVLDAYKYFDLPLGNFSDCEEICNKYLFAQNNGTDIIDKEVQRLGELIALFKSKTVKQHGKNYSTLKSNIEILRNNIVLLKDLL